MPSNFTLLLPFVHNLYTIDIRESAGGVNRSRSLYAIVLVLDTTVFYMYRIVRHHARRSGLGTTGLYPPSAPTFMQLTKQVGVNDCEVQPQAVVGNRGNPQHARGCGGIQR